MKRVLFLGNQRFVANVGSVIPADDNLLICYTTSTEMAASLSKDGAVDLIVIDVTSILQEEIDQLIGVPQIEDVDATAKYEEPEIKLPAGVEFYACDPLEEDSIQKLLAELKGESG